MKILTIHSDYLEFEPKEKALKSAEETEKKLKHIDECLVAFCSAEEGDNDRTALKAAKDIDDIAKQISAKKIVVYPFVHLSSNPAKPDVALKLVKEIEAALKNDYEVTRAPFGWYKAFTIKCKGHPLAELSREISAEGAEKKEEVSEAIEKEKELKSEWLIIEPNGKMHKLELKDGRVEGYDFKGKARLEKMINYEMMKSRIVDKEPPHIKIMRKLQLVDYEEASDPGNFRYMPKGKLLKALLEEWVTKKTLEYGAMEVETPIMYDYEHPSLKSYLNRFPARQYSIKTPNKNVFLRFSACFGQFLMMHDANISYKDLPLWLYELTKYSFRVEQRGELAGLRRLRTFTMPDCHAFVKDLDQAKQEMKKRFSLAREIQEGIGLKPESNLELSMRAVREFFESDKGFIVELVKEWGKPALIEIWDKRFFYFIFKHEWNFVDALDKAACLTTDQIDVENAERYGITYMDSDNKRKYPLILHLSPSGSIERVIYALLEKAFMEQEGKGNPVLPLWLSPTQVRICPVNDSFVKDVEKIAEKLEKENIRVDIDDRTESISKKIREAEMEWVPLIVVVGEKEIKEKKLAVRFRETGKVENMDEKEIVKIVKEKTEGFPYRPLPLPRLLTKRPVFLG